VIIVNIRKNNRKTRTVRALELSAALLAATTVFAAGVTWADPVESGFFKATGDTEATANTTKSVAAGNAANAEGTYSVAVGDSASASGVASIAIGSDTVATNNSAIAIGNNAEATSQEGHTSSLAIGAAAKATADSTLAIGHAAKASVSSSYAIGFDANASASHAMALGTRSISSGTGSVAIGVQTEATAEGAISIGSGSKATEHNTIAIGHSARTTDEEAIQIGSSSLRGGVEGFGSIAVGNTTTAKGQWYATAMGYQSLSLNDSASSYGASSSAAKNSVAIGAYSHAGTEDEDLGGFTLAKEIDGATNATAVGYNTNASGKYASAIGSGANATNEYATATGVSSQATGWGSAALSGYAKATNTYATAAGMSSTASGNGASALGAKSEATANYASAAGNLAKASGEQSTAVGYSSKASGKNSTAVGAFTNYSGNDSEGTTAIGYNSSVTVANGVALGRNSVADVASGDTGYDPATGAASTNTGKTWKSTMGAVSVGNSSNTRQIINVAAGSRDTDAVNVAQLKSAQTHFYSAKGSSGEGEFGRVTNYNNDGAEGMAAIAAGYYAKASGSETLAVGYYATALNSSTSGTNVVATALGSHSYADGERAQAFGAYAYAQGQDAIAIGSTGAKWLGGNFVPDQSTGAVGTNTIAIGNLADARDDKYNSGLSIAIGSASKANGYQAIALGSSAKAVDMQATAVGGSAAALGQASLATGANSGANTGSVALGYLSMAGATYDEYGIVSLLDGKTLATAAGYRSAATGAGSTALGASSSAAADNSVALGRGSVANVASGVAGYDPATGKASTDESKTWKSTMGAVSIGNSTNTRQIINVAAGSNDTDAVNVAQLKSAQTHYYSVNDTVPFLGVVNKTNYNNDGATGTDSLAAGVAVGTNGQFSSVAGAYSSVAGSLLQGTGASVFGSFNEVGAARGVPYDGVGNSVVGLANSTSNANGALIFGTGNTITNSYGALKYAQILELTTAYRNYADAVNQSGADSAAAKSAYATLKTKMDAFGVSAPEDGGDVLAIGGANTADYALKSSMIGVKNTITGTKDAPAEFNSTIGYNNTIENGSNNSIIGTNRKVSGASGVVVMGAATATEPMTTTANNAVAIGTNANVNHDGGVALGSSSTANVASGVAGYDPVTGKASTDATRTWKSTMGAVSVGDSSNTRQIINVAAGTNDTDAVNVAQLKAAQIHYYSTNDGGTKQGNYNNDAATGTNALAAGPAASAAGNNATALGAQATASGANATAAGVAAAASQENAIAVGVQAAASGINSGAYGVASQASAQNALALGTQAAASGENSAAFGVASTASAQNALAFGTQAAASGVNAIAIGVASQASNQAAAAMGTAAKATGLGSSAFGTEAAATGDHSAAFGASSSAGGLASTALGVGAQTSVGNATAVGAESQVSSLGGVALGWNSVAATAAGTVGYDITGTNHDNDSTGTWKSTSGAVSVGGGTKQDGSKVTRQIINVAAGREDTDAVNVAQLKQVATAVNNSKTHYYSVNSTVTGEGSNYNNDGATGLDAIAAGPNASATGSSSIAIGNGAQATVAGGVALGAGSAATTAAGVAGYDPTTDAPSTVDSPTWKSTAAAISVGGTSGDTTITRQITNVAAGTKDTDAVNVAQLKQTTAAAAAAQSAADEAVWSADVTADGGRVAGSGEIESQRIGDYKDSKNAGLVSFAAGKGIVISTDNDGKFAMTFGVDKAEDPVINADGTVADITSSDVYWDAQQVQNAVNNSYWTIQDGAGSSTDVTVGKTITISGDENIKVTNNEGTFKISLENVPSGDVSWNLAVADDKATKVPGGGTVRIVVEKNEPVGDLTTDVLSVKKTVNDDGEQVVSFVVADAPTFGGMVTAGGLTVKAKSGDVVINNDGISAGGNKITNVAKGDVNNSSTDAVNGSQLYDLGDSVAKSFGGTSVFNSETGKVTFQVKLDELGTHNSVAEALQALDTKPVYKHDITMEKNLTVGGTFTSNGPAVFNETVTMKKGLNMSGTRITNLAPGVDDTDAVNMSQLKAIGSNINYQINKMDRDISYTGSRAAALAALHPLPYDPDKPTSIMAGVGHYRGASSVALGVAHHFNDDTLLTVGSTVGRETMLNVGLSLRLGRNTNMTEKRWKAMRYSAANYDAKIKTLEEENSSLRKRLLTLESSVQSLLGAKGKK